MSEIKKAAEAFMMAGPGARATQRWLPHEDIHGIDYGRPKRRVIHDTSIGLSCDMRYRFFPPKLAMEVYRGYK